MPAKILTERQLNRALLERQLLVRRVSMSAVDAVAHLVGMQAQSPPAPYFGLWSRVDGFAVDDVVSAITDRVLVRASLMRGTIHLVTAADCRALTPLMLPIFERAVLAGPGPPPADRLPAILADATALLEESPRTLAELRLLLAERRPQDDPEVCARAARYLLPLVHVPPKGLWGQSGQARLTTARAWLGAEVSAASLADVLLRYLAAFGPASVKDMQTWCGLTGLREIIAPLNLPTYTDPDGTLLYDFPDASLPDPDTPAPTRLLPEYDNALRSHTNRRRVMSDDVRAQLFATKNDAPTPAFLVDGFVRGTWKLTQTRKAATVTLTPYTKLSKKDTAAISAEATRLLTFATPTAETRTLHWT